MKQNRLPGLSKEFFQNVAAQANKALTENNIPFSDFAWRHLKCKNDGNVDEQENKGKVRLICYSHHVFSDWAPIVLETSD